MYPAVKIGFIVDFDNVYKSLPTSSEIKIWKGFVQ